MRLSKPRGGQPMLACAVTPTNGVDVIPRAPGTHRALRSDFVMPVGAIRAEHPFGLRRTLEAPHAQGLGAAFPESPALTRAVSKPP